MISSVKIVAVLAVLSAAPLLAAKPTRHPSWMVGTWVTINRGEKFSQDRCNADHNVHYDRSGGYDFMDESGRWRVEGNRLIETMTRNGGTGDDRDLNRPRSARIMKRSGNMLKLLWHGGEETMMRCGIR